MERPKFNLGFVVCTSSIDEMMVEDSQFKSFVNDTLLNKYMLGDWGYTCQEDAKANDDAVKNGDDRILAVYKYSSKITIWIITEWDRSVTTILFPDEY